MSRSQKAYVANLVTHGPMAVARWPKVQESFPSRGEGRGGILKNEKLIEFIRDPSHPCCDCYCTVAFVVKIAWPEKQTDPEFHYLRVCHITLIPVFY